MLAAVGACCRARVIRHGAEQRRTLARGLMLELAVTASAGLAP